MTEQGVHDAGVGITQMSELAGLSVDTLRWYEKEGLLPSVGRDSRNRRWYSPREQSMVLLLTALRTTGLPASDMKKFVTMLSEGAASHARRIDLLEEHRERLAQRRSAIDAADQALQQKIAHYRSLIQDGLDCDGVPVAPTLSTEQDSKSTTTS